MTNLLFQHTELNFSTNGGKVLLPSDDASEERPTSTIFSEATFALEKLEARKIVPEGVISYHPCDIPHSASSVCCDGDLYLKWSVFAHLNPTSPRSRQACMMPRHGVLMIRGMIFIRLFSSPDHQLSDSRLPACPHNSGERSQEHSLKVEVSQLVLETKIDQVERETTIEDRVW